MSVDCRDGREPGARSRRGATDVTATRECAGSSVAVSSPAYMAVVRRSSRARVVGRSSDLRSEA